MIGESVYPQPNELGAEAVTTTQQRRTCPTCGNAFTANHGNRRYCSDACRHRGYNAARLADGRQATIHQARAAQRATTRRPCTRCGTSLTHTKTTRPLCRTCAPKQRRAAAFRRRAQRTAQQAATGTTGTGTLIMGHCPCGTPFTVRIHGTQRPHRYCSPECRQRYGRRPTLTKAQRLNVFHTHGWTCHLCHQTIDRATTDPVDDAYPTIDHVIPLAHGGTHHPTNWAPAHRSCNIAKSDRIP